MSAKIREIQTLLKLAGHDPGPLDGIWGRRSITATRAFQKANGLAADGIVGPVTLRFLNRDPATAERSVTVIEAPLPWVEEARRRIGLHETRDNSFLSKWLRSDKGFLGNPAKLPWCGDFVETAVALTLPDEPIPANPYLARNWAKFGRQLPLPMFGAIGVFWRGSRAGTSGHVGFLVGYDDGAYHVLGGNQSDSVSIARLGKDRLIVSTWPKSVGPPTRPLPYGKLTQTLSVNEA